LLGQRLRALEELGHRHVLMVASSASARQAVDRAMDEDAVRLTRSASRRPAPQLQVPSVAGPRNQLYLE
jgi:hypothetical protein